MSNQDDLLTQEEANNLLLHQKTEFRLRDVDKRLTDMSATLKEIKASQEETPKRVEACRDALKQEIETDFITKSEFQVHALREEEHWKRLNWMLAGAMAVFLVGGWLLSQYSLWQEIDSRGTPTAAEVAKEIVKALEENK